MENYENNETINNENEVEETKKGSSAPIIGALALGVIGGGYAAFRGIKWAIGKGKGALAAAKAKKEEKKAKKDEKESKKETEGKEEE